MTAHKLTFILFLTIAWVCLIIPGCCGEKEKATVQIEPSGNEIPVNRVVTARKRVFRHYGKLRLPAEIFVDLLRPERAGDPAAILISASSQVPASSGVITLRLPDIGQEPGRIEILWAGAPSDLIVEQKQYVLPALPVGKYHFVGILEFTPDREDADKLGVSDSLYLDVRADKILSSNVSFRQIERWELYRELEQRVLASLYPGLETADAETMSRYRDLIEATSPGLIESKIAELRATDPEVARRIAEVNSTKIEAISGSDANR
ncbi:MAG: hypothetical protein JSW59_13900 [Phycisphaerales bacterium]|nr:MAG: hypothetical protein JSW59_13900 [Phycisphaerales bacterium]